MKIKLLSILSLLYPLHLLAVDLKDIPNELMTDDIVQDEPKKSDFLVQLLPEVLDHIIDPQTKSTKKFKETIKKIANIATLNKEHFEKINRLYPNIFMPSWFDKKIEDDRMSKIFKMGSHCLEKIINCKIIFPDPPIKIFNKNLAVDEFAHKDKMAMKLSYILV